MQFGLGTREAICLQFPNAPLRATRFIGLPVAYSSLQLQTMVTNSSDVVELFQEKDYRNTLNVH